LRRPSPTTWQSDVTHWRLADGTEIEILNWLDDHSRYLLACTVHRPVSGDDVVTTFLATVDEHGAPASTLTDNGRVYTARFGGGRNALNTCYRYSVSARRTAPPDTRRPRARSSASTRPSKAGWPPGRPPAPSPSSKIS
jgi:hypothetical protein